MDKTCVTCIENDDGLCDRKGSWSMMMIPAVSIKNHGKMQC